MASGGYRPGAGRPRKPQAASVGTAVAPRSGRACVRMSPLDYLLAVLNDPEADPVRRDRAAIAAAPYVHAKPVPSSWKAQRELDAQTAERGTIWDELLT